MWGGSAMEYALYKDNEVVCGDCFAKRKDPHCNHESRIKYDAFENTLRELRARMDDCDLEFGLHKDEIARLKAEAGK